MLWRIPKVTGTVPPPSRAQTLVAFGHRVYLFGGGAGDGHCYNHLYVYSTRRHCWQCLIVSDDDDKSLPCPRRAHSAVVYNDKMYIFGGGTGRQALNDLWSMCLSKSNPQWTKVEPEGRIPEPRAYHSATVVRDTMIVFGGQNGEICSQNVYIYNFTTNHFNKVFIDDEIPHPRRMAHTVNAVANKLWVFGGSDISTCYSELWVFDLAEKRWELQKCAGTVPNPRGYHCAVYYDSRMFVFGGMNLTWEGFADVHVLEFGSKGWMENVPFQLVR
jgi:Rab9 effector protein with kelch motifs